MKTNLICYIVLSASSWHLEHLLFYFFIERLNTAALDHKTINVSVLDLDRKAFFGTHNSLASQTSNPLDSQLGVPGSCCPEGGRKSWASSINQRRRSARLASDPWLSAKMYCLIKKSLLFNVQPLLRQLRINLPSLSSIKSGLKG